MSSSPEWPTPYTVFYWEYVPGGSDPHRNPASFVPPLDQPGTPVGVYGWSLPSSTDPRQEGHPDRTIADGDLHAPTAFKPTPRSQIGLPDGRYEVVGDVRDHNHSPFNDWKPGYDIALRKVVG